MGLDVYLYRLTKPQAEIEADNEKWEAETSRIYDAMMAKIKAEGRAAFNDADRAEWNRLQEEAAPKFGRVVIKKDHWTSYDHQNEEKIERASSIHADHMFKVGYFRSSYNSGGIDRILDEYAKSGLAEIMGYDNEYCFCPDWAAAKERAVAVLELFRKLDAETTHRVFELNVFSIFSGLPNVTTGAEALKVAKEVIDKHPAPKEGDKPAPFGFGRDFTNSSGLFLLDEQPKVLAFIPGKSVMLGREMPAVWAVTEAKPGEVFGWYVKALEIVVETCDFVLNSGTPHEFHLHWSS